MNKILIVDDDPCSRFIFCNRLRAEGFETETVGGGLAALERLKGSPPDLVVLDLILPEVSGLELLKFIRDQESTRHLPVIVLSNAYERSRTEAAEKAGANLCLCKTNCTPRHLAGQVRSLLAAAEMEPAIP